MCGDCDSENDENDDESDMERDASLHNCCPMVMADSPRLPVPLLAFADDDDDCVSPSAKEKDSGSDRSARPTPGSPCERDCGRGGVGGCPGGRGGPVLGDVSVRGMDAPSKDEGVKGDRPASAAAAAAAPVAATLEEKEPARCVRADPVAGATVPESLPVVRPGFLAVSMVDAPDAGGGPCEC